MAIERVRISTITLGQTFPSSLFSISGQKLLNAGVSITQHHLDAMRRCGEFEAYVAESVDELVEQNVVDRIDGSKLKIGQTARGGVLSSAGQVLVEPGQKIEQHHLEAVEAGGKAYSSREGAQTQRRERVLLSDALVGELEQQAKSLEVRVFPEEKCDWIKPADSALWPQRAALLELRSRCVETLRQLMARVEAGVVVPVEKFQVVADELVEKLSEHPTRFTQLALLCPRREDYLPDHAFTVAVLAMATAANLKWSREHVRMIGLGGFLFDLGMLLVPERIRTGASQLSDIDRSRVHRHPIFTLAMMQSVQTVPPLIRLAALQHQERENGAGYPKGLRKDAVCDYARVLAVADTYAAITEPRTYRHPKLPYVAMEETLRAASTMVLWKPAVRALIQAAGLFPVGSYIKLSDGRNAHVIASNPLALNRPTVQPLAVDGSPNGELVDLSKIDTAELNVVRSIASAVG
jgi:HD-GYP domain-containing protein (c-di-GMP phosphodiesterase class II)